MKNPSKRHQILGTFTFPGGDQAVGELVLDRSRTRLKAHSDAFIAVTPTMPLIRGRSYDGSFVSLINSHCAGTGTVWRAPGEATYNAEVFPSCVVTGNRHLEPDAQCVTTISFTTSDVHALFYDFDAFGVVIDSSQLIEEVLTERRKMRPVASGPHPIIQYFTGNERVVDVETAVGRITVDHRPNMGFGSARGVDIKNHIAISITPARPVCLDEALERMYATATFLSAIAGRAQGIERVELLATFPGEARPMSLSVYECMGWKAGRRSDQYEAHPSDVPLDPIHFPDEFREVLQGWMQKHATWLVARGRYLSCLKKGNSFGPDRLVAAANMFDLLPDSAYPARDPLPAALAETRDVCRKLLREHPPSVERNSALEALGRMGQMSLPKKVAHRTSIVEAKIGDRFQKLQLVANVAVKVRNHFVHGGMSAHEFEKLDGLTPFLTNALEFVFCASDLIESGWDAVRWNEDSKGWGHSFARFRSGYDEMLHRLTLAVQD